MTTPSRRTAGLITRRSNTREEAMRKLREAGAPRHVMQQVRRQVEELPTRAEYLEGKGLKESTRYIGVFMDSEQAKHVAEGLLGGTSAYDIALHENTVRFQIPAEAQDTVTIKMKLLAGGVKALTEDDVPTAALSTGQAPPATSQTTDVWAHARAQANQDLAALNGSHVQMPWADIARILMTYGFDGQFMLGMTADFPRSMGGAGRADVGHGTMLKMVWMQDDGTKAYTVQASLTELNESINESKEAPELAVRYGGILCEAGPEVQARDIAKASTAGDDADPLAKSYIQYIKSGNVYSPAGEVVLADTLGSYAYAVESSFSGGPVFRRVRANTDTLLKFPSSVMESVLSEIDKFWTLESDYRNLGFKFSRGVLVWGPPGSGKSSLVQQVVEMVTQRGDVVFFAKRIDTLESGLKAFRQVEPTRKVVVILEDADEYVGYQEREFLQLMDGDQAQNGVLYLASTNYLNKFPARLLRPGRFDKKIYVGMPPEEGRYVYLKNKLEGKESDAEIHRLARDTAGFSFGHLREFVVAVYALKEDKEQVLARLRGDGISPDASERMQESVLCEGAVKQPWQMTKKEFYAVPHGDAYAHLTTKSDAEIRAHYGRHVYDSHLLAPAATSHQRRVDFAMEMDKPVPAHVRAEYPDLMAYHARRKELLASLEKGAKSKKR